MKKITKTTKSLTNKTLIITIFTMMLSTILTACGGSSDDSSTKPITKVKVEPIIELPKCLGIETNDKTSCVELDDRQALMYKNDNASKDGVVLFLHGAPGEASKVMRRFNAEMIANEHNLVAVTPGGIYDTWGWLSTNSLTENTNTDVDYISELLTQVRSEHNITSDKLYIFGYSAGGFMAYKLACAIPEQITAIVSLAGQYRGSLEACENSTPLAVHHFHSPSDTEVPYNGRDFGDIRSVEDTIELWRNKNGCDISVSSQEQVSVAANNNKTITLTYNNCLASVALSQMPLVKHDDSYISENLYEIYKYIFKK